MIDVFVFGILWVLIYRSASIVFSTLWNLDWILLGAGIYFVGQMMGLIISYKICVMLAILYKLYSHWG